MASYVASMQTTRVDPLPGSLRGGPPTAPASGPGGGGLGLAGLAAGGAPLTVRLDGEPQAWAGALQELQFQQMQALEVMTERVDLMVGTALERINAVASTCEARCAVLEGERVERWASLSELTEALASQRTQLAEVAQRAAQQQAAGLAFAREAAKEQTQQERRELLVALAAVCSDVDALQGQQRDTAGDLEALRGQHGSVLEELHDQRGSLRQLLSQLQQRQPTGTCAEEEALRSQQASMQDELQRHRAHFKELAGHIETVQSRLMGMVEALRGHLGKNAAELESVRTQSCTALEELRGQRGGYDGVFHQQVMGHVEIVHRQLQSDIEALWGQQTKTNLDFEALRTQCSEAAEQGRTGSAGLMEAVQNQLKWDLDLNQIQASSDMEALRTHTATAIDALSSKQDCLVELIQGREAKQRGRLEEHGDELSQLRMAFRQQEPRGELCGDGGPRGEREASDPAAGAGAGAAGAAAGAGGERPSEPRAPTAGAADAADAAKATAESLRQHGEAIDELRAEQAQLQQQQRRQGSEIEGFGAQQVRGEAAQNQILCDVGAIKRQLLDSVKALRWEHGKHSGDIELLRAQQHLGAMEALRSQHTTFLEATRATTAAAVRNCGAEAEAKALSTAGSTLSPSSPSSPWCSSSP